jgi:PPOX class probable FMN-dependent enzyme
LVSTIADQRAEIARCIDLDNLKRGGLLYKVKKPLTKSEDVQQVLGEKFESQERKVIDHIDPLCRAWIERSPFVTIATVNRQGQVDVAPKGDPAGFVKVLDDKTIAIPDRLGNHRGDSFHNIIDNPRIGLMFVIPMRNEVMRVSGSAQIAQDDEILDMMIVNDKRPDMAVVVHVEEAMYHCGKSMIRSRMWKPDDWASIDGLPSYALAVKTHADMPEPLEDYEAMMKYNDEERLY